MLHVKEHAITYSPFTDTYLLLAISINAKHVNHDHIHDNTYDISLTVKIHSFFYSGLNIRTSGNKITKHKVRRVNKKRYFLWITLYKFKLQAVEKCLYMIQPHAVLLSLHCSLTLNQMWVTFKWGTECSLWQTMVKYTSYRLLIICTTPC